MSGSFGERPRTLVEDREYFLVEPGWEILPTRIIFVAYTPCPAVVVVRDSFGSVYRCPRDELYELPPGMERERKTKE